MMAVEEANHASNSSRVIVLEGDTLCASFEKGTAAAFGEVSGMGADEAAVDLMFDAGTFDRKVGESFVVEVCSCRGTETVHGIGIGRCRGLRKVMFVHGGRWDVRPALG